MQNKTTNRDATIRNRMRKYDTYSRRPGSSRINISVQKSKINNQPVSPVKIRNQPIKHINLASQQKVSSISIALRAVNNSYLAQNEIYPDQISTIYGQTKRKLSGMQKFTYSFGVLVLVFSLAVSVQSFINNRNARDQVATLGASISKDDEGVSEGSGDKPSEEEVSHESILAYQVSNPQDPRYLRIPELNVFSRIKNLGIDSAGAVDAPHNIYDSGWYNGSVRPGSKSGSSLILGHVSGWTAPGVFKNVKNMKPGMEFEIEKGNGEKIKYEVTRLETIPVEQVDMSNILSSEISGEHDLKLMTCGGKFDRSTDSYSDRVVVYASPVK